MKRVVPLVLVVAALLAVGLSACGTTKPMAHMSTAKAPKALPTTDERHHHVVRIAIRNFAFVPARVVVSPGTRIVWTNRDSDPHTVTSDSGSGPLDSTALDTDDHFAAVVKRAGTTPYHCTIHPYMHGAVVVAN